MRNLEVYKEQTGRISEKLDKLRNRDKGFKIFGSWDHKYVLRPKLTLEEIEDIEAKYNVTFPEPYVAFLTILGNGGVGPGYGLYSLEKSLREVDEDNDVSKPTVFVSKDSTDEFMKKIDAMPLKTPKDCDDQYDAFTQVVNGTMEIQTGGCTFRHNIILNGVYAGKVIDICWDCFEDLVRYINFDKHFVDFLDWYEKWLDESIENLK